MKQKSEDPLVEFISGLAAAYPRFPMSEETKRFWYQGLRGYKLTRADYDAALITIIETRGQPTPESPAGEQSLPTIAEVKRYLRDVQRKAAPADNLAWATWRRASDGHDFFARLYQENGMWKEFKAITTLEGDRKVTQYERTGIKWMFPEGAMNQRITPNKEQYEGAEDHREDIARIVEGV